MNGSTPAASSAADRSRNRDSVTNVSLVVACQVFHGLTFGAIPLFLPLIREDLQMTFSEAGVLSAAATLSYGLGQIPAGYLSDRFGPKRLFFIGLLGWSVLSLSFGLIHAFWAAVHGVVMLHLAGLLRAPVDARAVLSPMLAALAKHYRLRQE